MNIEQYTIEELIENIIEGIQRKKGKEIVVLDFRKIENAVCQYFIICHANSGTQVQAISESIEEVVKQNLKERVWHREGTDNAQWILLDYGHIVAHVFQEEYRKHYKLESLWADAKKKEIKEI